MTKTMTVLLPQNENSTGLSESLEKTEMNSPSSIKNSLNRLDRDGVNLSFDNSSVDMSLLSTVHVCAAQVRR